MKPPLAIFLLLASCSKSSSGTVPGYVIRVHLDSDLTPSSVGGIEVRISKSGGFPDFPARMAGDIRVESKDTNADSQNEVVLTWPDGFAFEATENVRLVFDNTTEMPIAIAGTATDTSGATLAAGSASATVPAGGNGEADVTLACVLAGCVPAVADGGDAGPPDAGPDVGPDVPAGVHLGGETVSAAGTSTAGTLKLEHNFGHPIGRGTSSAGSLRVESIVSPSR
jgi:hypothetical protein